MRAAGRRDGAGCGRADGSRGSLAAAVEGLLYGAACRTGDGFSGAAPQTVGKSDGRNTGAMDLLVMVCFVF